MEIATEDHSGLIGACDRDYGCIYMNTLSWRTPTTPMPMEINPRKVFERMFGQGDSVEARLEAPQGRPQHSRRRHGSSDGLATRARRTHDRQTLDNYLEGVREIERRLNRAETQLEQNADLEIPEAPAGIPFAYDDHVRTMFDLLTLAYQRRHHARVHVHDGARGEQPHLHAGGRHRGPPRRVASPEPGREARGLGADPGVSHRTVRRVPRRSSTRRPTARARCSTTRCFCTAAT